MIESFHPDLVLLDIMMPGINGIEAIPLIKERANYDLKIIMFSNLYDKNAMERAIELGADDFLFKADTTPREAVEKVTIFLNSV